MRFIFPFFVVGLGWEAMAMSGYFPVRLFPSIETIIRAFVDLSASGIILHHTWQTLLRLFFGVSLACIVGVAVGMLMGRNRGVEKFLSIWVSMLAPIPGLAYAPLFMLWFGLGNMSTVLLVAFVACFPIIINTSAGVKGVKELWIRSAQALGADERQLFRLVILPASLPYILTGVRLGLAQGWRILVAAEMLAAVPWGLGWLIFGAREFMNTDIMLAGIAVIGATGLFLENVVFKPMEHYTVIRWGMMTK